MFEDSKTIRDYRENQFIEHHTDRTLGMIGIPRHFLRASFDNFLSASKILNSHLARCREFAANPKGFLLLIGKPGNGKTHLAASILRHRAKTCDRYIIHCELVEALREGYKPRREARFDSADVQEACLHAKLLVIDEIGVAARGNDADTLVFEVLNYRYAYHKPTVLCSNLPLDEFSNTIGERTADRVREAMFCQPLFFNEESYRCRESANEEYLSRCPDRKVT